VFRNISLARQKSVGNCLSVCKEWQTPAFVQAYNIYLLKKILSKNEQQEEQLKFFKNGNFIKI
jgi:hypothetical protein